MGHKNQTLVNCYGCVLCHFVEPKWICLSVLIWLAAVIDLGNYVDSIYRLGKHN